MDQIYYMCMHLRNDVYAFSVFQRARRSKPQHNKLYHTHKLMRTLTPQLAETKLHTEDGPMNNLCAQFIIT